MRTSSSIRWLTLAVSAAMLLVIAVACAGETVEVPGETIVVEKEVIKEVMVPGETVVVEKEVIKEVMVPGETVTKEVVKEVEVPGETVVVEKEVVKTVEVPGQTVVVEKEVVKEVERAGYVTDPTTGKVLPAPEYGGTITYVWNYWPPTARNYPRRDGQVLQSGVSEMLAIADWGIDRSVHDHKRRPVPLWIMVPLLAESWETPDDTTAIFDIRDGVNWHNKAPMNGRDFTAQDVVYNYHRYLGLGQWEEAGPIPQFATLPIDTVEATDDDTVVFKLKEPFLQWMNVIFNHYPPHILPPEVIEEHGDMSDWRNAVGTGPFELVEFGDSAVTYEKFPDYHRNDEKFPENQLPYVDKVRALRMPDDATRISALRTGKIDYLGWSGDGAIGVDQMEALRNTNDEMTFIPYSYRSNATSFSMNLTNPIFQDIRVRKAMQLAQDIETINAIYYRGWAMWEPQGLIGDGAVGYYVPFNEWPEELKEGYQYNPELAEQLLDEAGYPRGPDGVRFSTKYLSPVNFKDLALADIAASYWKQIGIEVEITEAPDGASYGAAVRNQEYEGLSGAIMAYDRDPALVMRVFSHSEGGGNYPGIRDEHLDSLIEAAEAATTIEEQQKLIIEADQYVLQNHWFVWYFKAPAFNVIQPWLIGYNGEYFLGFQQRYGEIMSRLWIHSEVKEKMGY